MTIIDTATRLQHTDHLIDRFTIYNKKTKKPRQVNNPIPELKQALKAWNAPLTAYYVERLKAEALTDHVHAYLPNKSIKTNAAQHAQSSVIQFDFSKFYDHCAFDYFYHELLTMDPDLNNLDPHLLSRLIIDPNTGGVTQGLPVSGALAGLSLIPFWLELKKALPSNVMFTQYSDDLTFSYYHQKPNNFNIPDLTRIIYQALGLANRKFLLNTTKTRQQHGAYRNVTGVSINHNNKLTSKRKDYRFLRHVLHILSQSDNLDKELAQWQIPSKASLVGKISYMRSMDDTGKIDRLIQKYKDTCVRHNLFTTWLNA